MRHIWRSGLSAKPRLEPDALWRVGARGFDPRDEFGGRSEADAEDFRERLAQLCRSLREEARLNALGHTLAYGQLTAAIRKRHALGRLWRQRPEFAATPISPPIAVVGQMRAGTTRVHRLLAADPAHTATRFCDSFDPVPKTADWRALKGAFALALARRINPWLDTLHPFGATRADEEIGWLSAALGPCAFEAQWTIPSYVEFSEGRDPGPVYSEFARILRTDAAIRRNADRPWVLKCPQYAEDLTALASALPDIRVVAARRADEDVLQSTLSMVASQMAFQSDAVSLEQIESGWRRKLALRNRRMDAALGALAQPCTTVDFEQLNANWRAAMARVYADLGLDLTPGALAAMERERSRAAGDAHHAHRPQIARFEWGQALLPTPGIKVPTERR